MRVEPYRLAGRVVARELAGGLDAQVLERLCRTELARQLFRGDRARAQQLPRAVGAERDDRRFDAARAHAPVEDRVYSRAERGGDVFWRGRTDPPAAIGRRCG